MRHQLYALLLCGPPLLLHRKVDAPVFLHALVRMFETQRTILPVARRLEFEGQSQVLEVGLHISGPAFAQDKIVGGCSDFIATAFEHDAGDPAALQLFRIRFQYR
jgi:hypothetical protein